MSASVITGCDVGEPERQPIDAPLMEAPSVLGTLGVDVNGNPLEPQSLKSANGSTEVTPSTSLRLRFNRFLLPSSVVRQAFCLSPSTADVANFADCANGVFLNPSYDPVRREVVLRQPAGERLPLATPYKLTVFVPLTDDECSGENPAGCGVRAFDRAPLEKVYTLEFRTLDEQPDKMLDETAPPAAYCDPSDGVAAVLGNTCAYSRCHAPAAQDGPGAAMGLDFSEIQFGDPTALRNTAINHVAHQTQMGEAASDAEETPARFGRAMPIIDAINPGKAGSPGNSYLMYKVLTGTSVANLSKDVAPSADEIDRLLASVVVGMPMPAPDPAAAPLSETQLLNLSNWIARGAPTPACP